MNYYLNTAAYILPLIEFEEIGYDGLKRRYRFLYNNYRDPTCHFQNYEWTQGKNDIWLYDVRDDSIEKYSLSIITLQFHDLTGYIEVVGDFHRYRSNHHEPFPSHLVDFRREIKLNSLLD